MSTEILLQMRITSDGLGPLCRLSVSVICRWTLRSRRRTSYRRYSNWSRRRRRYSPGKYATSCWLAAFVTGCRSRASAPSTGSYATSHQSARRFTRRQQVRSTRCRRWRCHCATTVVFTRLCDIVPAGHATWPPRAFYSGRRCCSRRRLRLRHRRRQRLIVKRTTRRASWTSALTNVATWVHGTMTPS